MSEWKTYKLGDVVDILGDGIHGTPLYNETGAYYFINGNNLGDGFIKIKENTLKVDETEYLKHKKNLTDRTLLVSINGTLGNVAKYRGEPCILGKSACYLNISKSHEKDFIYYIIASANFRRDLENMATGTTIKNVSLKALRNYEISLPPLETQKRIADILSAIDDKIELNRRINANLEQQAQALYKLWFVDFEPFGGKMPEDWREGTLGEIAEFRRGKGILGKDTIKGNIPVVAGGLEPAYYHNLANTKAPVVTISASGANAGFMRMYNVDVWASDCSYIDSRCANLLWTYCYLKINAQLLKHAQTGAVQPHVKASDVNAFEIIIPSSENILNFQQKVKPIFDQIANNERENIHLAQLRDTLLPKLMSGEIKV